LEENVLIVDKGVEFDALDWWKGNALMYWILSILAKDILTTPITTVISESTFSAGRKVILHHRALLSIETVQMVVIKPIIKNKEFWFCNLIDFHNYVDFNIHNH
jgi:hypothetical protein